MTLPSAYPSWYPVSIRQRKAMSPAFSNAAIRRLTSISAYKLKTAWDNEIEASHDNPAVIEVQSWMNYISLDSIGIAGFSHDFGTLHGKDSTVANVFDAFSSAEPSVFATLTFMLGIVFPFLIRIPTRRRLLMNRLNASMEEIARELLANTRKESVGEGKMEKSIIELLIKAEDSESDLHMSQKEVLAQMKVLFLAGYETTSISLTWALIETCKKLEVQGKLRTELVQLASGDPYLDAVVHEVLRLHPPVGETTRVVDPTFFSFACNSNFFALS
ncbi:hypothetical protein AcW2_006919 [Taiwanofungus camphoratus]|nr:hypothetical protein AcW2_006919 [Antrodia cinnamomea]